MADADRNCFTSVFPTYTMNPNQYQPGDPRLVKEIVDNIKSRGVFDEIRKECLADVDTKPAYQNLKGRVDNFVNRFLSREKWSPTLNKNQLRNTLRKEIADSGMLSSGVDRIIEQVVNPKVYKEFKPVIEKIICQHLGIEVQQRRERERRQMEILQKIQQRDREESEMHESTDENGFTQPPPSGQPQAPPGQPPTHGPPMLPPTSQLLPQVSISQGPPPQQPPMAPPGFPAPQLSVVGPGMVAGLIPRLPGQLSAQIAAVVPPRPGIPLPQFVPGIPIPMQPMFRPHFMDPQLLQQQQAALAEMAKYAPLGTQFPPLPASMRNGPSTPTTPHTPPYSHAEVLPPTPTQVAPTFPQVATTTSESTERRVPEIAQPDDDDDEASLKSISPDPLYPPGTTPPRPQTSPRGVSPRGQHVPSPRGSPESMEMSDSSDDDSPPPDIGSDEEEEPMKIDMAFDPNASFLTLLTSPRGADPGILQGTDSNLTTLQSADTTVVKLEKEIDSKSDRSGSYSDRSSSEKETQKILSDPGKSVHQGKTGKKVSFSDGRATSVKNSEIVKSSSSKSWRSDDHRERSSDFSRSKNSESKLSDRDRKSDSKDRKTDSKDKRPESKDKMSELKDRSSEFKSKHAKSDLNSKDRNSEKYSSSSKDKEKVRSSDSKDRKYDPKDSKDKKPSESKDRKSEPRDRPSELKRGDSERKLDIKDSRQSSKERNSDYRSEKSNSSSSKSSSDRSKSSSSRNDRSESHSSRPTSTSPDGKTSEKSERQKLSKSYEDFPSSHKKDTHRSHRIDVLREESYSRAESPVDSKNLETKKYIFAWDNLDVDSSSDSDVSSVNTSDLSSNYEVSESEPEEEELPAEKGGEEIPPVPKVQKKTKEQRKQELHEQKVQERQTQRQRRKNKRYLGEFESYLSSDSAHENEIVKNEKRKQNEDPTPAMSVEEPVKKKAKVPEFGKARRVIRGEKALAAARSIPASMSELALSSRPRMPRRTCIPSGLRPAPLAVNDFNMLLSRRSTFIPVTKKGKKVGGAAASRSWPTLAPVKQSLSRSNSPLVTGNPFRTDSPKNLRLDSDVVRPKVELQCEDEKDVSNTGEKSSNDSAYNEPETIHKFEEDSTRKMEDGTDEQPMNVVTEEVNEKTEVEIEEKENNIEEKSRETVVVGAREVSPTSDFSLTKMVCEVKTDSTVNDFALSQDMKFPPEEEGSDEKTVETMTSEADHKNMKQSVETAARDDEIAATLVNLTHEVAVDGKPEVDEKCAATEQGTECRSTIHDVKESRSEGDESPGTDSNKDKVNANQRSANDVLMVVEPSADPTIPNSHDLPFSEAGRTRNLLSPDIVTTDSVHRSPLNLDSPIPDSLPRVGPPSPSSLEPFSPQHLCMPRVGVSSPTDEGDASPMSCSASSPRVPSTPESPAVSKRVRKPSRKAARTSDTPNSGPSETKDECPGPRTRRSSGQERTKSGRLTPVTQAERTRNMSETSGRTTPDSKSGESSRSNSPPRRTSRRHSEKRVWSPEPDTPRSRRSAASRPPPAKKLKH